MTTDSTETLIQVPTAQTALGRWVSVRIAGLPIDVVDKLLCEDSAAWAVNVLDTDEELRARAQRIGDSLHDHIGDNPNKELRRALLALRRGMFNNQPPEENAEAMQWLETHDPPTANQVRQWLADHTDFVELNERGTDIVDQDLINTRKKLRTLAADQRLSDGILLASGLLHSKLDKFENTTGANVSKRERKTEQSVLSYLLRSACKTSPFSKFTTVHLAEFDDDGVSPHDHLELTGEMASHLRVSVVALNRIAERIQQTPAARTHLRVDLTSGWGRDEDRIQYVRRWVSAGEETSAVTFDSVSDRIFFVRSSEHLDAIIDHVAAGEHTTFGQLEDWFDSMASAPRDECRRYLELLVDIGILHFPAMRIDVHDTNPLLSFAATMDHIDELWATTMATDLRAADQACRDFENQPSTQRAKNLKIIRDALDAALDAIDASDQLMPQTLVYEDVVLDEAGTYLDREAWASQLTEPLTSLNKILPALDMTLAQRLTTCGFFKARFGVGGTSDDALGFIHDYYEDFLNQYLDLTKDHRQFDDEGNYNPEANWLRLPSIKALDTARQQFVRAVTEIYQQSPDADEVILPESVAEQVGETITETGVRNEPHAYFLQVANTAQDPRFVVNQTYGGLWFPFSRFAYAFDEPTADQDFSTALREEARQRAGDSRVYAEVTGGMITSNLNLHPPMTEHVIVCPGETSSLPADRQFHLDALRIRHLEDEDRLMLEDKQTGREVVPVYLGYLVPLALPEIARALLLLSPVSMAPLDPWQGVPLIKTEESPVDYRPRVVMNNLVLKRRTWTTLARHLPRPAEEADEAQRYLGWRRFQRTVQLPQHVFAKVADPEKLAQGGGPSKPQYVDFNSIMTLRNLESHLKSDEASVTFAEMMPDRNQMFASGPDGKYVTELGIESYTPSHRPTT